MIVEFDNLFSLTFAPTDYFQTNTNKSPRPTLIRPVAGQGSSPSETRFSFLKHFRILYPLIPNTIQINQRFCDNWHCEDLIQKNSKSVTLILRSCNGIGMVLQNILDKALSSRHNWIISIEGFAKKMKMYNIYHETFIYKFWVCDLLGWEWYHIKFWTSFYHHAKHESIHQRLHKNRHCKNLNTNFNTKILKSVTLTLKSCTGLGIVLHKILDQHLSSYQT